MRRPLVSRIAHAGFYRVELYMIVQTNNAATVNALVAYGRNKLIPISFVGSGPSGWIDLGIYRFNGSASERVRMTRASSTGVLRADAVRFTPVATPITTILVRQVTWKAARLHRAALVATLVRLASFE